jgi:ADP-ribose pyrophosphatase YjhB (NUDIX family)
VKVLLQDEDGKFLLIRRSQEKYPEVENPWDIPGGRINIGSPLLENLQREVTEETSLKVLGIPELVDAQDIIRPEKHVVRLTYIAQSSGHPQLSADHTEFQWLERKDALELQGIDPFVVETLQKLAARE